MMFLSAASISALVALSGAQDGAITSPLSENLARHAEVRTLTISESGKTLGLGVVIDPKGLAITPGEVAFDSQGKPRTSLRADVGDRRLPIEVIGFDSSTDLALVSLPVGESYPSAALATRINSNVVLVMMPSGPVRAQVAVSGMGGVMALTGRYMPLSEIRLDSGGRAPTGAPVFLPDGSLAGLICAELSQQQAASDSMRTEAPKTLTGFAAKLGPLASATAFSLDLPVLERVIDGFKTPNRVIEHPWVGLFFKTAEAPTQGAVITRVVENSPGEEAGIQVGDTVTGATGQIFNNHVEFASFLFGTRPGERITLSIVRGISIRTVDVAVAREPSSTSILERKKAG